MSSSSTVRPLPRLLASKWGIKQNWKRLLVLHWKVRLGSVHLISFPIESRTVLAHQRPPNLAATIISILPLMTQPLPAVGPAVWWTGSVEPWRRVSPTSPIPWQRSFHRIALLPSHGFPLLLPIWRVQPQPPLVTSPLPPLWLLTVMVSMEVVGKLARRSRRLLLFSGKRGKEVPVQPINSFLSSTFLFFS